MTVNPGFRHQHFLRSTLPEVRRMRENVERVKPAGELVLGGGANLRTKQLAVAAGANVSRPARLFSATTRESP